MELGGQLTYGHPKTGRSSFRTLPASVMKILVDHMATFTPTDPDAFVFQAPDGGPTRVPLWRQRFWRPGRHQGGAGPPSAPRPSPHRRRPLDQDRADPLRCRASRAQISQLTQDRYGHLFPEADREVADRLDALILITSAEKAPEETDETKAGSNSDGRNDGRSFRSGRRRPPVQPSDQGEDGGRCGTRTHDLSRVKAAL